MVRGARRAPAWVVALALSGGGGDAHAATTRASATRASAIETPATRAATMGNGATCARPMATPATPSGTIGTGATAATNDDPARVDAASGPARYGAWPAVWWAIGQLVPSPEIAAAHRRAVFGLRWQITPVLWSWGVHRGAWPWRAFVVEPIVRHAGSIEAFVSPEWLFTGAATRDEIALRPGVRAYFPLAQRGEYLSTSIGTSYAWSGPRARGGAAYEAGLYTLFGIFGVQIAWSPSGAPADVVATLAFRVL